MIAPYYRKYQGILLAGDCVAVIVSFYLAFYTRLGSFSPMSRHLYALAFSGCLFIAVFYVFDLYNLGSRFKSTAYLAQFIITVAAGTALVAFMYYFISYFKFGRGVFLFQSIYLLCLGYAWRRAFYAAFKKVKKRVRIIIIGANSSGREIYDILSKRAGDFRIVGVLDDDPGISSDQFPAPYVGTSSLLISLAEEHQIDAVVVSEPYEQNAKLVKAVIEAKMRGVEISDMPSLYEDLTGKLPVAHLSPSWIAYSSFKAVKRTLYTLHLKRAIDIVLAVLGIVICFPLAVMIALAVRLESRGPVIYRQQRIGTNDEPFVLLKFRSMIVDAEKDGAVWATSGDPRITKVGRLLRLARLDEIPQLWNVLRGEMSFIGPRPERPEFVNQLKEDIPYYSLRHSIKPGLTGWAQVHYRYGASAGDALEKLQYDLFYLKNQSLFLDFLILLSTIRVVFLGKGAR